MVQLGKCLRKTKEKSYLNYKILMFNESVYVWNLWNNRKK